LSVLSLLCVAASLELHMSSPDVASSLLCIVKKSKNYFSVANFRAIDVNYVHMVHVTYSAIFKKE